MGQTIKLYANYGVLAHEKRPTYTEVPADCPISDPVEVEVPEWIEVGEFADGSIALTIDGADYRWGDLYLSTDADDRPVITWFDGKERFATLAVVGLKAE